MALPPEEKDAANAVVVLMAHAVMTYHRNLSFDIVYSFYKPYLSLIGSSMRRMMMLIERGYIMHDKSSVTEEESMGTFHWVIWLLDRRRRQTGRIQTAPQSERLVAVNHASSSAWANTMASIA